LASGVFVEFVGPVKFSNPQFAVAGLANRVIGRALGAKKLLCKTKSSFCERPVGRNQPLARFIARGLARMPR